MSARCTRPALAVLLGVAVALGACASIERARIAGIATHLVDAGFTATPLTDPTARTTAQGLAPGTLVARNEGGALSYLFADPEGCQCLYRGSEAAYRRYEELAENQRMANELTTAPGRQRQRQEQTGRQ